MCAWHETGPIIGAGGADMKIFRVNFSLETRNRTELPGTRMCAHSCLLGVPPHASPPPAAAGPAEGYFIHTNPSAAFPEAHPPKSGTCGLAIFATFRRIAWARVYAPFRYRSRVRERGENP